METLKTCVNVWKAQRERNVKLSKKQFEGSLVLMKLVSLSYSNSLIYKQSLAVDCKGTVSLASYNSKKEIVESFSRSMNQTDAKKILEKTVSFINQKMDMTHYPIIGSFDLILINDKGQDFFFSGSLGNRYCIDGEEISCLIRTVLDRADLLVFDGQQID